MEDAVPAACSNSLTIRATVKGLLCLAVVERVAELEDDAVLPEKKLLALAVSSIHDRISFFVSVSFEGRRFVLLRVLPAAQATKSNE